MTTTFRVRAAALLAALFLAGCASAPHGGPPSSLAAGMPGALGTIEFKPKDWQPGVKSWWLDTDGVDPGVAGCHVGVTQDGKPNGRFFGEACLSDKVLVESNPGVNAVHGHDNDLGHPDTFDCNAWCVGAKNAKGGMCKPAPGPAPCNAPNGSARCECS